MKITIHLPDDLLIEAKKRAAEKRTTIRALVERGSRKAARPPAIRWITVKGGLPRDLDVADRAAMTDWLQNDRS